MDVGANADCKPDYLFQFGIMGHWYANAVLGIDSPKIGLINIGEEEEKGSLLCQAAYKMMKDNDLFQFIGNIEGRDMFSSEVDVMVTDGFTGNVMLKLAESFYRMIRMRKIQDDFFKQLNYEIYGGSPILGVNGNVIIGHGSSSATAIGNMIAQGYHMAQHGLREKIETAFQ
jgi:glycerol-3-phosphate acyltransferase PlsX